MESLPVKFHEVAVLGDIWYCGLMVLLLLFCLRIRGRCICVRFLNIFILKFHRKYCMSF